LRRSKDNEYVQIASRGIGVVREGSEDDDFLYSEIRGKEPGRILVYATAHLFHIDGFNLDRL